MKTGKERHKGIMKRFICVALLLSVLASSACSRTGKTVNTAESTAVTTIEASETTTTGAQTTNETTTQSETTTETTETPTETTVSEAKYAYGVFLSVTKNIDRLKDYETVVIDAQHFTKEQIEAFKVRGHKVYSYINIGSLENFRSYYKEYKDLKLGKYEHWDEEIWINVADQRWQDFMQNDMIPNLTAKGIDGFFVDNCDVYYNYRKPGILDGLTSILKALVATGKAVLINGGDCYLDSYCKNGGSWRDVITGINQETVFSKIIWDKNKFGIAGKEDHKYFLSYIERYAKQGADIYLLEYTKDKKLIKEIEEYCANKGFVYYVSDSVELD